MKQEITIWKKSEIISNFLFFPYSLRWGFDFFFFSALMKVKKKITQEIKKKTHIRKHKKTNHQKTNKQKQLNPNSTSHISTEITWGHIQQRTEGLKRQVPQGSSYQSLTTLWR